MSVKDIFSYIGVFFSLVVGFFALLCGKNIYNNRKRTGGDTDAHQSDDVESQRADRLSQEAGESAQRISDIVERVKSRE